MTKIVINTSYNQPFDEKIIEWFRNHGVILPPEANENFFIRHDPLLVQCVEENRYSLLGYLEIKEIKGNIYRIDYDYDYGCEFIVEPKEDDGWICANDNFTLIINKSKTEICSKTNCPYCFDDDKQINPINPKWCEHCTENSIKTFLGIKEVNVGDIKSANQ